MRSPTILALALTLCAPATAHPSAKGMKPSPAPEKLSSFKWTYPFTDEAMTGWTASCTAVKAFSAREYTLHDLANPFPKGLGAWVDGLKGFFSGREYPGAWGGWDKHLHDRTIVYMEYEEVPLRVREWIEEQERGDLAGKGLFAVFEKPAAGEKGEGEREGKEGSVIGETVKVGEVVDRSGDGGKVVMFAPGALYEILPLWVADGSDCQDVLLDLSNYQPTHADGAVVAWPKKTNPTKEKVISIEITASQLAPKPVGSEPEVVAEGGDAAEGAAAAEETGKVEAEGKGKDEL
ncbi:uncharacterized protein DNG_09801 [Cephalotrichum gorgonifer]|uniref:Uncharacterized protein n=1 Tax=Cephalotrichum gorgonifer TaxID=2041049 RepID=A0AAE8N8N2_9PEZI|nr:uncharacterized protein DNG_09801 [Cephalotrichum gorgonifer]